jgi:hypothetical protein
MLAEFTAWLLELVTAFLEALAELLEDVLVGFVKLLTGAVLGLLELLPVPDFLSNGLASVWSALPAGVLWVVSEAGMPEALAIIGTGYAFRLARKAATLFQW